MQQSRSEVTERDGLVELSAGSDVLDSPRYNHDIAPTRVEQRTWNRWHITALWIGMSICVPTYTLGGVLTAYFGLSVGEALLAILLANLVVLIPLTLNAFAGTRYGIPFPVLLRASFGIIGSNVPCLIRAVVACGWFGIQTLFGGLAIHLFLGSIFPAWKALGGTGEVIGFLLGAEPVGGAARRGVDQMAGDTLGTAAGAGRPRPAGVGAAAHIGQRTAGAAAEAPGRRQRHRLLHGRADGDGRLLGHAVAEHPRLQPLCA